MIKLTNDNLTGELGLLSALSPVQQIILNCDGSLTRLLEVIFQETVVIDKLVNELREAEKPIPELMINRMELFLDRKIILKGKDSGRPFMYASSKIALGNLTPEFYDALINSGKPIGYLWELFQIETYKRLLSWGAEAPTEMMQHFFNISAHDKMFYRSYLVYSQNNPTMLITEKFPTSYYRETI